jgi:hypothetical protein
MNASVVFDTSIALVGLFGGRTQNTKIGEHKADASRDYKCGYGVVPRDVGV